MDIVAFLVITTSIIVCFWGVGALLLITYPDIASKLVNYAKFVFNYEYKVGVRKKKLEDVWPDFFRLVKENLSVLEQSMFDEYLTQVSRKFPDYKSFCKAIHYDVNPLVENSDYPFFSSFLRSYVSNTTKNDIVNKMIAWSDELELTSIKNDSALKAYFSNYFTHINREIVIPEQINSTLKLLPNISKFVRYFDHYSSALNKVFGIQPMISPVGVCYMLESDVNSTSDIGRNLIIKLVSHGVEARSTKFADLVDLDNTDIDDFMADQLTKDLAKELVNKYFSILLDDINTYCHNKISVIHSTDFISSIGKLSSAFVAEVHRGYYNIAIMSPTALRILYAVDLITENDNGRFIKNTSIEVMVRENLDAGELNNTVILAYAGNQQVDRGLILAPYIPLIPTDDQHALYQTSEYISRFGYTSGKNGYRYYAFIDISKITE